MRIGSIVRHVGSSYVITAFVGDNRVQISTLAEGVIGRDQGNHPRTWFEDTGQLYIGPNAPVPILNHECYLVLYENEPGQIRPLVRATFEEADRWIRNNQEDVTILKRTKVTVPYTLPTE